MKRGKNGDNFKYEEDRNQQAGEDDTDYKIENIIYDEGITQHDREEKR